MSSIKNDFDANTTPESIRNHAITTRTLTLVSQTQNTDHNLIHPLPTTTLQLQLLNNNDKSTNIDNDDCSNLLSTINYQQQ